MDNKYFKWEDESILIKFYVEYYEDGEIYEITVESITMFNDLEVNLSEKDMKELKSYLENIQDEWSEINE